VLVLLLLLLLLLQLLVRCTTPTWVVLRMCWLTSRS
jgi:hypothetical protein